MPDLLTKIRTWLGWNEKARPVPVPVYVQQPAAPAQRPVAPRPARPARGCNW